MKITEKDLSLLLVFTSGLVAAPAQYTHFVSEILARNPSSFLEEVLKDIHSAYTDVGASCFLPEETIKRLLEAKTETGLVAARALSWSIRK